MNAGMCGDVSEQGWHEAPSAIVAPLDTPSAAASAGMLPLALPRRSLAPLRLDGRPSVLRFA